MTLQIARLALVSTLAVNQLPQTPIDMARVSGQVVEEGTNTRVVGARVFVILEGDPPAAGPPPAAMTDGEGRYQIDVLPAGRYRIAAQKAGYAPPMEPETMQMFEVAAGQALDGVTVSLRKGGVIAGRVLDSFGQPIADGSVTALLKRLNSPGRPTGQTWDGAPLLMPFGQSQTNDRGQFRIFGLAPGEYVIVANTRAKSGGAAIAAPAPTTMTATFFPGTGDAAAAQPVSVESGETVSDVTIQLVSVPAFQVSGVVVDETGAAVEHAMVMLMDGPSVADPFLSLVLGPPLMTQSDPSGRFTFGDVPAGSYTLHVENGPGGLGAFGVGGTFGIDSDGTPRAAPGRAKRAPEPGTLEVTVENENVGDLKIIVRGSQ
jgi:protocatechuate 3,4-dioxygenase beta subunit